LGLKNVGHGATLGDGLLKILHAERSPWPRNMIRVYSWRWSRLVSNMEMVVEMMINLDYTVLYLRAREMVAKK